MMSSLRQGGRLTGWRWLAPLAFLALFVLLFASLAIVRGVGAPSIPSDSVAIVEGVPGRLGVVTDGEFQRALAQSAAQAQIEPIPKPGEDQYDTLREAALRSLFDPIWIRGQAEEMGISVTPEEVGDELEKLKQRYKTEGEYEAFLQDAGYTPADIEESVATQLISSRIQERIDEETPAPSESDIENYYAAAKSSQFTSRGEVESLDEARAQIRKRLVKQGAERASNTYLRGYIDRWTARTYCAAGFAVVTHCSNFVSDGRPPESNPACYEADPEGGQPSACQAPVLQAKPAQPGTVSPLNPEGLRLAQGPRPRGLEVAAPGPAGE